MCFEFDAGLKLVFEPAQESTRELRTVFFVEMNLDIVPGGSRQPVGGGFQNQLLQSFAGERISPGPLNQPI